MLHNQTPESSGIHALKNPSNTMSMSIDENCPSQSEQKQQQQRLISVPSTSPTKISSESKQHSVPASISSGGVETQTTTDSSFQLLPTSKSAPSLYHHSHSPSMNKLSSPEVGGGVVNISSILSDTTESVRFCFLCRFNFVVEECFWNILLERKLISHLQLFLLFDEFLR